MAALLIGAVTMALIVPSIASRTASRMYVTIIFPAILSGLPIFNLTGSRLDSLTIFIPLVFGLSDFISSTDMTLMSIFAFKSETVFFITLGSPSTTGIHSLAILASLYAFTITSGPMPVGSPIVIPILGSSIYASSYKSSL